MKHFLFLVLLFTFYLSSAQNLHTQSNAASIDNESEATTGWSSGGNLTSSSVNPYSGSFSLSVSATASNERDMNYTFNAIVGEQYEIRIWSREGDFSNAPAFANWTGFNGFSTTVINGAVWVEYTWTLTATNTSPLIRVYTSPYASWQVGHEVLIDNVSIQLVDDENPSIPTGLAASAITSSGFTLSWTASTDNIGVTDYEVFKDGVSVGLTSGATSLDLSGLTAETTYQYSVEALDLTGNRSGLSEGLDVITLSAPDEESPSIPTGLFVGNLMSMSLTINWNVSSDNVSVVD